ncbi:MAG: 23S rRNA (adenine(2503)-C(2))-methyltransferase RlmN, partial [Dongiaceae bacterium]
MSTAIHATSFAPPVAATGAPVNLVGLDRVELEAVMTELGQPKFRARQLWHWIYHRGATDFDAMTTLAKELRALL